MRGYHRLPLPTIVGLQKSSVECMWSVGSSNCGRRNVRYRITYVKVRYGTVVHSYLGLGPGLHPSIIVLLGLDQTVVFTCALLTTKNNIIILLDTETDETRTVSLWGG